jgi:hypothetical protein
MAGKAKFGKNVVSTDDFLIAQFNALASHIIGLFNAGTQRVAAYLIFVGLVFTAINLVPQTNPERGIYVLGALVVIFIVGYAIWRDTIHLLIQVMRYLRIMNGIRGYFNRHDPTIARLCPEDTLPITSDLPKWNQPIFDPGLSILEIILFITMVLLFFKVLTAYFVFAPIWRNMLVTILSVVSWVFLRWHKRKLRLKLDTSPKISEEE